MLEGGAGRLERYAGVLNRMRTSRGKFVVVIVPMIIACTLLTSIASAMIGLNDLRDKLAQEMENVARTQALALRIPVWNYESQTLQSIAEAMLTNPAVSATEVRDNFRSVIAKAERRARAGATWTIVTPIQSPAVAGGEELIGDLVLVYNDGLIRNEVSNRLWRDALLLLLLVVTISASAIAAHLLTIGRPLDRFLRAIHRAEDPRLRQPVPVTSQDEIGRIMAGYNRLLAKLAAEENERTRAADELRAARDRAEKALADLRTTQRSLIEAEKMASLGQMVAGVAHEINTPVGIALTAASHLADETRHLRTAMDDGSLRKSQLADYVETAADAARLLMSNMHRASELIQSFKQVAVDRSSDERRGFDLRAYVDEVILSLGPRLKRTRNQVLVRGEGSVMVDSYPGPIAQLVTNLVINALVHAFGDDGAGTLAIDVAALPDGLVELRFQDDGRGIPAENLDRIFEPFFTTKRGAGGSGLGMHICFNLVTRTLGGTLTVESRVGEGTTFTARFPAIAPAQSAPAEAETAA